MSKLNNYFRILKHLSNGDMPVVCIVLPDGEWYALRAAFCASRVLDRELEPEVDPLAARYNVWLNGIEFKSKSQMDWLESTKRFDERWDAGYAMGFKEGFRFARPGKGKKK